MAVSVENHQAELGRPIDLWHELISPPPLPRDPGPDYNDIECPRHPQQQNLKAIHGEPGDRAMPSPSGGAVDHQSTTGCLDDEWAFSDGDERHCEDWPLGLRTPPEAELTDKVETHFQQDHQKQGCDKPL